MMGSLGDYLKRERELRKVSLEEISRTTKIRKDILIRLEEDQLDSLASPVFIKGFLRAYASYVGLDPDDLVLRYEASLKEEEPPGGNAQRETPRQRTLRYIVLPVGVLLASGILLSLVLHQPQQNRQERGEKPVVHARKQEPPRALSTPDRPTGEAASYYPNHPDRTKIPVYAPPPFPLPPQPRGPAEETAGVRVRIAALEDAWIRIQVDQGEPREMLLRAGETVSRQGKRDILMKIGNAWGVEIVHNGKNLGKLGESGRVVYLSLTPEGAKLGRPRNPPAQEP
ncbi:MAG: helix-turn-helix domain-containing protein [Deltaproteobacteria bacterium]|nr:helix-turn-helix domain-containing protein [Deltaproteobacteria bacterium]